MTTENDYTLLCLNDVNNHRHYSVR